MTDSFIIDVFGWAMLHIFLFIHNYVFPFFSISLSGHEIYTLKMEIQLRNFITDTDKDVYKNSCILKWKVWSDCVMKKKGY